MDQAAKREEDSRSLDVQRRIDAVCVVFENAWKSLVAEQAPPEISSFLGDVPEPVRDELVRELLRLDLEYRRDAGCLLTANQYAMRLPGYERVVEDVWQEFCPGANGRALPPPANAVRGSGTVSPKVASPEMSPAQGMSDRQLLFAMLAVEMGFLTQDQLVAAMHVWRSDRTRRLEQILVQQQVLSDKRRKLLEELVAEQIAQHDNDPQKSVSAAVAKNEMSRELGSGYARQLIETLAAHDLAGVVGPSGSGVAGASGARVAGGRFRVLEFHDKGALGQVMLAEDAELGRTVAVKEIQSRYADDAASRQRFVLEAEITGGLEHPGIVPVYGKGIYPDGRPYYAMRFIRGDTLGEAIKRFHAAGAASWDAGRRTVELHKLLRRFLDICNAMQYAHSRGVLHRDIKPSNVMLGKYGETLVVDWGLAKILGRVETIHDASEATLHPPSSGSSYATLLGSAVGTPAYMSPEQAAGAHDQLGPASDVYGLGATLYCLLAGRPAFRGTDRNVVLAEVQRGAFPRPRTICPDIPPALEAICLKAMATSPQDRYPTCASLVEDIEHWLADEPVSAYVETRGEQIARWMRRHRTWVQAGAVSLLATAAILFVSTLLVARAWRHETAARELAQRSKQEAVTRFAQARNAIDKWLTGATQALGYYPSFQKTQERLLQMAAADYERLAHQRSEDLQLEIERGRTYLRLGHIRWLLRDGPGATEAYQSARTLYESLAKDFPENLDVWVERANSQTNLGVVLQASGSLGAAERAYDESILQLDNLWRRGPDSVPVRAALATALLNRSELLVEIGRWQEAEEQVNRSCDLFAGLVADTPESVDHETGLASARDIARRLLVERGRYAEAAESARKTIAHMTWRIAAEPTNPGYLESRGSASIYLAGLLRLQGRYGEEANSYRQALEDYETLCEAMPGVPQWIESRAIAHSNLAGLLYRLGQLAEADRELAPALADLDQLRTVCPRYPQYLAEWAYARDVQGEILRDRGQLAEARTAFEESLAAYQELIGDIDQNHEAEVPRYSRALAVCSSHLGQTWQLLGETEKADQLFQAAIALLTETTSASPFVQNTLAVVRQHRANLLHSTGQAEAAEREFRLAQEAWSALAATADAAAEHRYHLAWFFAMCPQSELRDASQAWSLSKQLCAEVPENADYRSCLALAEYRLENWSAAATALDEAIRLREIEHGRDWLLLSMARWQLNDRPGAEQTFLRGAAWVEENMPKHLEMQRIRREAAELLQRELEDDRAETDCPM